MSSNAVAIAVIVPTIVMVGLLLIVIAVKLLDIARERARSEVGSEHPAFVEMRQVVGADLAEIRRRLESLEQPTHRRSSPPREDRA